MVLEIRKLLARGAYTGDFTFELQPDGEYLLLPMCNIDGTVKVTGSYEIFDEGEVEVRFTLTYRLVGQCSYCLKDASCDIEYSAEALFVVDKDDGDNYRYNGNTLDLAPAVNDALLFSQPKVLLCSPDCEGIKLN